MKHKGERFFISKLTKAMTKHCGAWGWDKIRNILLPLKGSLVGGRGYFQLDRRIWGLSHYSFEIETPAPQRLGGKTKIFFLRAAYERWGDEKKALVLIRTVEERVEGVETQ